MFIDEFLLIFRAKILKNSTSGSGFKKAVFCQVTAIGEKSIFFVGKRLLKYSPGIETTFPKDKAVGCFGKPRSGGIIIASGAAR